MGSEHLGAPSTRGQYVEQGTYCEFPMRPSIAHTFFCVSKLGLSSGLLINV